MWSLRIRTGSWCGIRLGTERGGWEDQMPLPGRPSRSWVARPGLGTVVLEPPGEGHQVLPRRANYGGRPQGPEAGDKARAARPLAAELPHPGPSLCCVLAEGRGVPPAEAQGRAFRAQSARPSCATASDGGAPRPSPAPQAVPLSQSRRSRLGGRDADLRDADQPDRRGCSHPEEQPRPRRRGEQGGRADRRQGLGAVRDARPVRLRHRGRGARREDDGQGLGRAGLARDDDQPDPDRDRRPTIWPARSRASR